MHVYARALTHRSFCRVVERPEGVEGQGSVRVGGVGRTDGGVARRGDGLERERDENTSRRERVAPTLRREYESSPREPERTCGHTGILTLSRCATYRAPLRAYAASCAVGGTTKPRLVAATIAASVSATRRVTVPVPASPSPSPSPRQRNHVTRSRHPASASARDMSRIPDAPAPLSSPFRPRRPGASPTTRPSLRRWPSTTPSRTTYPRVSSERSVSSSIGAASGG